VQGFAQREKRVEKTFDGKTDVRIKLVLGDCALRSTQTGRVTATVVYTYDEDEFEPRFRERGGTVYLEEKFYNHGDSPGGYSKWTIEVPEDVEVDFSSATGDVEIEGIFDELDGSTGTGYYEIRNAKGDFELSTGTGDIDIEECEGEFELSSGTGDVRVEDCTGNFDVSSGTGDVEARNISIDMDGEFSSGTGDAEVSKPMGDDFYLSVSSGTDDAVLDMKGEPIQGGFVFRCHARKGRIISPVKFDTENVYDRGDNEYLEKIFKKGKDTPRYEISTGTGTARLVR
jgi:hypothetical protein